MSQIRTHYDNLQVKETASDEVIKGAYRYLSQKWHPDRNRNNTQEAERVLKIINQAYAILSDPRKRMEHDEWIKRQKESAETHRREPPPAPPPPQDEQRRPNEDAQPDSLEDESLRLFIGRKHAYYRRKWDASAGTEGSTSWNWAAFFLGLGWMAYRKMYMNSFIYIGVITVEILVEIAFNVPEGLSTAITFGIAGVFGVQGNYWYKLHAERKIKEILAFNAPEKARPDLERQGGTSIGAAIGFPVLLLAIVILINFVAEPLTQ